MKRWAGHYMSQDMGMQKGKIKTDAGAKMRVLGRRVAVAMLAVLVLGQHAMVLAADDRRPTVMVLGDSLVAGHGLPQGAAFPDVLGDKLAADGMAVRMINAGVSGDTTAGGLARLDWSLAENPDAAIIVLGGNDLLRGLSPEASHANLDAIIQKLRARGIPVLLAGMQAPRNFGADYANEFDAIYRRLASQHEVLFYPFFLAGVALRPEMNLSDGMHPNAKGIDHIASTMLPLARRLVELVKAR